MNTFQHPSALESSVDAMRKDLLRPEGPQISTVRNYNFAILPYDPGLEFTLRRLINGLCAELRDGGWTTGTIPLHALMLARLRAEGPELIEALVAREKRLSRGADPRRGLRSLTERVVSIVEGPDGLARDVIRAIERILEESPESAQHTVIFLGRAGALYPFFRTSALLKHVAGHTRNVPVVLLYPGRVEGETGLSFMGILPADSDYRPRIYR